jgi:uncharacterized protein (TIGR02217 family)
MTFLETQFPSDISYGATGGPTYSTDVVTMFSGHEQRNSNWKNARGKYNIATGVKTEDQWHALISFFRSCKGKASGFRFKDWGDYKVKNQQIGIGDGETTEFQLVKFYTSGATIVTRIINKPVVGTVKIYLNGQRIGHHNLRGATDDYSVDYAKGIITFTEAPEMNVIITADFEFDVPVRFDTDELQLSIDSFNSGSWSGINLIEVRI